MPGVSSPFLAPNPKTHPTLLQEPLLSGLWNQTQVPVAPSPPATGRRARGRSSATALHLQKMFFHKNEKEKESTVDHSVLEVGDTALAQRVPALLGCTPTAGVQGVGDGRGQVLVPHLQGLRLPQAPARLEPRCSAHRLTNAPAPQTAAWVA